MFPLRIAVPTRFPPTVTWALIAANAVVFLIEVSLGPRELAAFLARFASFRRSISSPGRVAS